MKNILFVLEYEREFGFLSKMNQLRYYLEFNYFCSMIINKMAKVHNVFITSKSGLLDKTLESHKNIHVIGINPIKDENNCAMKQAISISRSWHSYGRLSTLLNVNGISFGEVVQHYIMGLFFPLFLEIDYADRVLKEINPARVYVQSDFFSLGKVFPLFAERSIESYFLEPKLYKNAKNFVANTIMTHNRGKYILKTPCLYLIQEDNKNKAKYSIFFDVPYSNDLTTVISLIRTLVGRHIFKCYIYTDKSFVADKLNDLDLKIVREKINLDSHIKIKELKDYFYEHLVKDNEFKSIFTYNSINFWAAIENDMRILFDKELGLIINDTYRFEKIIDIVKPEIVIVGDDRATRVRGHVILAKQRGILVMEVQHGMYSSSMPADFPLSDKVAAGGIYYKKVYTKYGADDEQVVITGWPKFDIYKELKEKNFRKETVDILFATDSNDVKFNIDIIKTVSSFVEDIPNLRLIVKPHPSENKNNYTNIIKNYKKVILTDNNEDINALLASSDLVMMIYSTIGIEAIILDKPLICINRMETPHESIFASSEAAIQVNNLDQLVPVIKDVLFNQAIRPKLAKARSKFVNEHAYLQDGKSSERVSDLILKMIEDSSSCTQIIN
jgi:hypothetical protein